MSLEAFRKQHPEYDDVSDRDLADAIYRTHYSDIPRADFDQRMGLDVSAPKQALEVRLEGTDTSFKPDDPRSQSYSALNEQGLIDPAKPKGDRANPRIIGDDNGRPPEGEWYVDRRGKLVQSSSLQDDIGQSYVTGLGEATQGLLDPEFGIETIGSLFGIHGKSEDNGFSPMDIIQSAANAGVGLGQRIAGDQGGAERSFETARANTAQERLSASGMDYDPQTGGGKIAKFAGQMTPGIALPGSSAPGAVRSVAREVAARGANVIVPAATAYAGGEAGQAIGGERGEQIGALAGGFAGGVLAGVRPTPARPSALNSPAARLQAEGVPITPGQKAGGVLASAEDRATSIPLVGDVVRGAKVRSVEGFNRAVVNRALKPIGEDLPKDVKTGRDAVAYAGDRLSQGYDDVLSRVVVQADQQFAADIATIQQAAAALPDAAQAQLSRVLDQLVTRRLQGQVDGATIKAVESEVGKLAADYGGSAVASERQLGELLGQVRGSIRDQVARSNPDEAAQLAQLDEGWANLAVIERAAAQGKDGIFTPGQARTAMRQSDRSVRKRATARGTARMQQLIDDAQAVLPSSIPESGTAGRLMAGVGALGLAKVNPLVGVPVGGALALYSEPGISAFNALSRTRLPGATYGGNYATPLVGGGSQLLIEQRRVR